MRERTCFLAGFGLSAELEQRGLALSAFNQHLSPIRALVDECAQNGLLDQSTAVAIARVEGSRSSACGSESG